MTNQNKIRSKVKAFLPGADANLIDSLVAKVEQDLFQGCKDKGGRPRNPGQLVRQIIKQEELMELGLK